MRKKLLALLLAAAMALSLLAGCGGGKSVAQALLKLLEGKYQNVSVEMDPELEADLRQVLSENENDDLAAIRAALEKLVGSTVTFRYLGEGQQGATAFDLVFFAGTDPDKAAQAAYSQWNGTFSTLPDDGKYTAALAMVQAENGCFALVKATVDKAGTVDKPEPDPEPEPEKGYTETTDGSGTVTGYTVNTKDGLQELFKEKKSSFNENTVIKLTADKEYTVTEQLTDNFVGELTSDGGKAQITLSGGASLFGTIADGAKVSYLDITVSGTISVKTPKNDVAHVGAVAGTNKGTIQNCDVKGGTIQGDNYNDNVGGIVGYNYGTIQSCSSAVTVRDGKNTGGIAGRNGDGGSITDCCSTGTVTSNSSNSYTGGVVGYNEGATITACYSIGDITSSGKSSSFTGGVAGANTLKSGSGNGQIIACYSTGEVSGTTVGGVVGWNSTSSAVIACYSTGDVTSSIDGGTAGGVVGENSALHGSAVITACYWSGQIKNNNTVQNVGHGIGYDNGTAPSDNGTTKVTGDVTWQMAVDGMNTELEKEGCLWCYELTDGLPTLKNQ